MLTPRFQLSQDDKFLYVTIYAPFTHLAETEIFMDGTDFRFFSKPYYLRLHLPGEVEENEDASGNYNADTSSFEVKCPKRNRGEEFDGLDMITSLLTPPGATSARHKVEECDGNDEEDDEQDDEQDDEDIDWYMEQTVLDTDSLDFTASEKNHGYGFGFTRTGVFSTVMSELQELLDVKDPDGKSHEERHDEKERLEAEHFSDDHYLCDLYDCQQVEECLEYSSIWAKIVNKTISENELLAYQAFSIEEQEKLLSLPKRKRIIAKLELNPVFFSLVDVLYAYCYDYRINLGESNSESGWCVAKLAATLSCCCKFKSLKKVLRSCLRRSLVYPLYRHWQLSMACLQDLSQLLKTGRVSVVKSLIHVAGEFASTEGHYIHNQLWLDDMVAWVQAVPELHLLSLADAVSVTAGGMDKASVGLDLDVLEKAAELAVMEDGDGADPAVDDLASKVGEVALDSDDDSDSESDDSEEDSSSEEEEDSKEEVVEHKDT